MSDNAWPCVIRAVRVPRFCGEISGGVGHGRSAYLGEIWGVDNAWVDKVKGASLLLKILTFWFLYYSRLSCYLPR